MSEGRSWRSLVAIAAVLIALAAAILLPLLLGRGKDGATAPTPSAQASTSAQESPNPQAAVPPPPGYQLYRDPAGWSLAVPTGWQPQRSGTAVTFTDQGRTLKVSHRPDPPADPYDDALKLEPVVKAATPGYDLHRIARVSYRGWPTADWEYTAGTLTTTRTLTRAVVPGQDRMYTLSWTTPDRLWQTDRGIFDTVLATFAPQA